MTTDQSIILFGMTLQFLGIMAGVYVSLRNGRTLSEVKVKTDGMFERAVGDAAATGEARGMATGLVAGNVQAHAEIAAVKVAIREDAVRDAETALAIGKASSLPPNGAPLPVADDQTHTELGRAADAQVRLADIAQSEADKKPS